MDKIIILTAFLSSILVLAVLSQLTLETETKLATGGVAIGLIIGIMKFYSQQKSGHNLEFSKLLTDFEDNWSNARTNWAHSDERADYDICYGMCAKRLAILDSLAFLTNKGKINSAMMKYFETHSSECLLYLEWVGGIEPSEKKAWGSFSDYVDKLNPRPKIASARLLPPEFHDVYKTRTTRTFEDDVKLADKTKPKDKN